LLGGGAALCRVGDQRSGGSAATIPARRDACHGGNLIALPSVAFASSPVKPAAMDLLCRIEALRRERADDLGPAPASSA
jgi:hypothetical protein